MGTANESTTGRLGLIIAAGGYGLRLGAGGPKQYVPLLGIPMVQHTIEVLEACAVVDRLVVVVNPEDVDFCSSEIVAGRFAKVAAVVGGGSERALSVLNGLEALTSAGEYDFVGVHDGARPLVTCGDVARARERLLDEPDLAGVVVATPSVDTLKRVDERGMIVETPDRTMFWRALTPQLFRWEAFQAAYRQPAHVLSRATDDSSLVESSGGRVAVVEGAPENLKVTNPTDILVAERIMAERRG